MTLLNIPTSPVAPKRRCRACEWFETLSIENQEHFRLLVDNYPIARLYKTLVTHTDPDGKTLDINFSVDVFRKHLDEAH